MFRWVDTAAGISRTFLSHAIAASRPMRYRYLATCHAVRWGRSNAGNYSCSDIRRALITRPSPVQTGEYGSLPSIMVLPAARYRAALRKISYAASVVRTRDSCT